MFNERLWFAFFILLAFTLNFSFVYGDIADPDQHGKLELFFAFLVSVVCMILKFGDRTYLGVLLLAASMVANLHFLLAIFTWTFSTGDLDGSHISTIVSFCAGALVANAVSVVITIFDALGQR
ncbi:MAG: hypothetical protein J6M05_01015 [Cardiobacteriaceae bacterium]|nr:hypothetical protein [Cardiobacteriaceae bacterium]